MCHLVSPCLTLCHLVSSSVAWFYLLFWSNLGFLHYYDTNKIQQKKVHFGQLQSRSKLQFDFSENGKYITRAKDGGCGCSPATLLIRSKKNQKRSSEGKSSPIDTDEKAVILSKGSPLKTSKRHFRFFSHQCDLKKVT